MMDRYYIGYLDKYHSFVCNNIEFVLIAKKEPSLDIINFQLCQEACYDVFVHDLLTWKLS